MLELSLYSRRVKMLDWNTKEQQIEGTDEKEMENLCDGQVEGGSAGTAGSFAVCFIFIYAPLEL